jgi:hypothetical protein
MSGLRYVLLIGFFALLAGFYLGDDQGAEESPARNAGLERAQPAPQQ